MMRLDDYIDADVAYLAGLVIGRGSFSEISGIRQLAIEFSHTSLVAEGVSSQFDLDVHIRLGLDDVRERLQELLGAEVRKFSQPGGVQLVARFMHNSMSWRNLLLLTDGALSFRQFHMPSVILDPQLPRDWKREFVRGFADVAGNVRHSNRYVDGRHRVRLDVLNAPGNWQLPVQLCTLLQEHLDVPVQLIAWGHPNLGRGFREHQVDVFAQEFVSVGFALDYKQRILSEFADWDRAHLPQREIAACPGCRRLRERKPGHADEHSDHLDAHLRGHHFDAYWQICQAMGCARASAGELRAGGAYDDEIVVDAAEQGA